jgi:hypothetical protein
MKFEFQLMQNFHDNLVVCLQRNLWQWLIELSRQWWHQFLIEVHLYDLLALQFLHVDLQSLVVKQKRDFLLMLTAPQLPLMNLNLLVIVLVKF